MMMIGEVVRDDASLSRLSLDQLGSYINENILRHTEERHNFCITEARLPLLESDLFQMGEIAAMMPGFLNGLGRLQNLALIDAKKMRTGVEYKLIRELLGLGHEYNQMMISPDRSPARKELYQDEEAEVQAMGLEIADDHPFCRIDLVRSEQGKLAVAEIEVDKLHGLGYGTLCRQLSDQPIGVGLANRLAELSATNVTGLILADTERFYLPESLFLAQTVNKLGGKLVIMPQDRIQIHEGRLAYRRNGQGPLFIDQLVNIPVLTGEKNQIKQLEGRILETGVPVYSKRAKNLGEKTTMALVHNGNQDPELENLLRGVFGDEALARMRSYIPFTEAMSTSSKERRERIAQEIREHPDRYFVKVKDASGARGIIPPGNPDEQCQTILGPNYKKVIVQEAISSELREMSYQNVKHGDRGTDVFSTRYALFVSGQGEILDLALTCSPGIVAHGGQRSIMTGYTLI